MSICVTNYSQQPDEVPRPTISDTVLVRAPLFVYNKSIGRLLNKQTPEHIAWEASDEQDQDDETAKLQAALPANASAETRKRRAKAK